MELSFKHCLQLVCPQAETLGDTFYLEWSDGGSLRQDKSIEGKDRIVKRCIHDGTLSFTHDLIREALKPLDLEFLQNHTFILPLSAPSAAAPRAPRAVRRIFYFFRRRVRRSWS